MAGGARVRVLSDKPQEVLLPIPQLADAQVPLAYFVESHPGRRRHRVSACARATDGNVVVGVRLAGKKQDVRLAWSAVVLLAPKSVTAGPHPGRAVPQDDGLRPSPGRTR